MYPAPPTTRTTKDVLPCSWAVELDSPFSLAPSQYYARIPFLRSVINERRDRFHHQILLLGCHFRKYGQRQHFPAGGFRRRQIARLVPQISKRPLQVQRYGVINLAGHSAATQMLFQLITSRGANHLLIVDMGATRLDPGQPENAVKTAAFEHLCIACGVSLPSLRPLIEVAELDPQN